MDVVFISKLMYFLDVYLIFDLYYLGVKWGWKILVYVLEELVKDGDLIINEVEEIVVDVFRKNVIDIY